MVKRSMSILIILLSVIIVALIAALRWQQTNRRIVPEKPPQPSQEQVIQTSTPSMTPLTEDGNVAEYRSVKGVYFKYPRLSGTGDRVFILEERPGVITLFPESNTNFTHSVSVHYKLPTEQIENALVDEFQGETGMGCEVQVRPTAAASNGQLRFKVLISAKTREAFGMCANEPYFVQYNPARPDVFVVFMVGQDTFLNLAIIENSLVIE